MTTTRQIAPSAAAPAAHARAVAAALALLALVAGVPLLLATFVGDPLPHHLPTGPQLHRALTRPLSDLAVVRILAVVAWLAWLHLLINVTRELSAQLRGLPAPRRLPLLGAGQGVARQLVATALLLVPATASMHATPVAALTRAVGNPYPTAAARPTAVMTLVEQHGSAFVDRDAVTAACTSTPSPTTTDHANIAPAPHKAYVVQPPHGRHYDSLWDIAERHLCDGRRYREIYELNKGRPQPDGGELTRASLIQPGWVLLLPADATGPGVRDVDTGASDTASPPQPRGAGRESGTGATLPHLPPPPDVAAHTAQPRPADDGIPEDTGPTSPRHDRSPARQSGISRSDHGLPVVPVAIGLGVGSLAALAALQRARRIALRRRPLGQRPAPTPEHLRPVEAGLRIEARRSDPIAAAVRLAVALAEQRGIGADITCVLRRDDGGIELHLADPSPRPAPPPFTTTSTGWQLPADAAGFTFAVETAADPLPALLQVGRAGDAEVYINLAHGGFTAVDGESAAVDDLLATAASRVAGAPWAGSLRVLIPPGMWSRVGSIEHVQTVADLAAQVNDVLASTAPARMQPDDPTSDGGANDTYMLVGWRCDELPDELVRAALDPASRLLVLAAGEDECAAQQWRLDGESLIGTGVDPLTVAPRPAAADQVVALIEHARTDPAVPQTDPAFVALREQAPLATSRSRPQMTVDVLGPVEVRGVEEPTHGPRRTPPTRILVYLALHRRGVTAEQLSTALWPDEIADPRVVRNRVAEARALVNGAITNGPGWRLEDTVGSDWQEFQALAAGSPDDQVAALELVRGQPFDGFTDEWVDVEMLRTDMVAAIVDLAAAVAERALEDGDPSRAFRAARTGLRASPYEERLYRLAMRAADAEGSTGKLHALMNELRRVLDVHVEPDDRMQRETIALYEELTSTARRRERV